jgi:hypothetical protein
MRQRIEQHRRDLLGKANQALAAAADQVFFLVSGLPMRLKGQLQVSTRSIEIQQVEYVVILTCSTTQIALSAMEPVAPLWQSRHSMCRRIVFRFTL